MVARKPPKPVNKLWLEHQRLNDRPAGYKRAGKVGKRVKVKPQVFDRRRYMNALRKEWGSYSEEDRTDLVQLIQLVINDEGERDAAGLQNEDVPDNPYEDKADALGDLLERHQQYVGHLYDLNRMEKELSGEQHGQQRLNDARAACALVETELSTLREAADSDEVQAAHRAYLESTSGTDGPRMYQGFHHIGRGAFGFVGFFDADANGNVINRVAVKDTYVGGPAWREPLMWRGNLDVPGDRIPMEVYAMSSLRSRGIVKYLSWRLEARRMMYRIYMEHCPHGDHRSLWRHYRSQVDPDDGFFYRPPEPYIWYLFENLAKAAYAMQYTFNRTRRTDDKVFVHLDIKPDNVFLGAPSSRHYPAYPAPRLGDFGLALETFSTDENNPRAYHHTGTPRYRAPEVMFGRKKILGPADIWSIGTTVMSVMDLSDKVGPLAFDPENFQQWRSQLNRRQEPLFDAFYTKTLVSLVKKCVRSYPSHRITVIDLLREIQANTGHPQQAREAKDCAEGMRSMSLEDAFAKDKANLLMFYKGHAGWNEQLSDAAMDLESDDEHEGAQSEDAGENGGAYGSV